MKSEILFEIIPIQDLHQNEHSRVRNTLMHNYIGIKGLKRGD